jgi:glycosyltransferase involved in cell wall biosynthesis
LPVTERFAVVIPALNAESSVGSVARGCLAQLPDVVVVDDGSIDATSAMAADAGAIVLRHPRRRGKGGAMKTGFAWALSHGFDGVIGVDADGQHLPSEIPKLLRCRAESGADLVIGGRSHLFAQMLPRRRRANRFSTWAIAMLSGASITDSQCGFRLYSVRLLRTVSLRAEGFDMDSEVIVRAGRAGLTIAMTSIEMGFVDGITTSHYRAVRDTLRIAATVLRVRFFG